MIEGKREIIRALYAGIDIQVLISLEGQSVEVEGIEHLEATHSVFKKLSIKENPSESIAVAKIPTRKLEEFSVPNNSLILVAVGLEKPGNLGAILRSADAAGANAVLVEGGVDLWNPQVIRNSTGVVFTLPTFIADSKTILEFLKQNKISLIATTPNTEQTLWSVDLKKSVAFAVGPEHEGLNEHWISAADEKIRIPMEGTADSLNVSVSAALVLFEAARQRNKI